MKVPLVLASAAAFEIKKDERKPEESTAGLLDEMEVNKNLNLFEGDIEIAGEMNIQTDLTFRWPGARLYVDVGEDLSPNVVGVLHQEKRFISF